MSDWIKENPFTAAVLATFLLLTITFFSIIKPYIDSSDSRVYMQLELKVDSIHQNISRYMDTLIVIETEQILELKKLNNE